METEIDASNRWFLQKLADGDAAAAAAAYEGHAGPASPGWRSDQGAEGDRELLAGRDRNRRPAVELEPLERRQAAGVVCETGRYRFVLQRAEDQPTLEHGAYVAFHRKGLYGSWLRVGDTFNREPVQTAASSWVTRR